MTSNCTFSDESWFTPNMTFERLYTCIPKSEFDPSASGSTNFVNHLNGKSNSDAKAVLYSGVVMKILPRNLSIVFTNLTRLTIEGCGLRRLSKEDLIGLENLDTLCVERNQLTTLPDDLLVKMSKLRLISFKSNQLRILSSQLLLPVVKNQLVAVDLRENVAINAFYGRLPAFVINPAHNWYPKIRQLMAHIDETCEKPEHGDTDENISLLAEFEAMRQSERLTDFVISVGSEEFPVHKTVLAAQSTVFADIFESRQRLATRHVIAADISVAAVEDFLDYLYTRKLPNNANMLENFKLAAKYEVAKLKSICERLMWKNLDEGNALEIFTIGGEYSSEVLKILAFAEIKEMLGGNISNNFINEPARVRELLCMKQHLDSFFEQASSELDAANRDEA